MKKEKDYIVSCVWIKRQNNEEVLMNSVDLINASYSEDAIDQALDKNSKHRADGFKLRCFEVLKLTSQA